MTTLVGGYGIGLHPHMVHVHKGVSSCECGWSHEDRTDGRNAAWHAEHAPRS